MGEALCRLFIRQHKQVGGGCIHIWIKFSFNHLLPLHVFRASVNAVANQDVILDAFVADAFTNHLDMQLLSQDNRRAHTAHINQK